MNPIHSAISDPVLIVDCLTRLFWDFTSEDVQYLRSQHHELDHVWKTYIEPLSGEATFNELWRCWMLKLGADSKQVLIDHALNRFGEEIAQSLLLTQRIKKSMVQQ